MNIYKIGDIVTLKSHPLTISFQPDYESFSDQFPPLMVIKDITIEDERKKIYSSAITDAQIASQIKYKCIYFNEHKSSFEEAILYQNFLVSYSDLHFIKKNKDKPDDYKTLIQEVANYQTSNYEFGKIVQFKTAKLESRKIILNSFKYPTFRCPELVITGLKEEEEKNSFYEKDGTPKRIVPSILYKVTWFNQVHDKFSEHYLPKESLIEPIAPYKKPSRALQN
ncbi:MAG: hypothetical protein V7767_10335 [Leeuwenhoekiella sp.]